MTMIQELTVQDFAIISNLNVSFKEGMTVLTGETGAGKSIIIDAMGLLVGGRGSVDYIRDGAERCRIEGSFYVEDSSVVEAYLSENGIDHSDSQLVLQREIYRSGRNVCRINGQLVTTKVLRGLGKYVVDIHGQNEHQELMQPQYHLELLDQFSDDTFDELLNLYKETYVEYVSLDKKISSIKKNEKAYVQRMDMLNFQYEEIESAQLVDDEEEELVEERKKLMNFQKITDALRLSYHNLDGEDVGGALLVANAMNEMESIEDMDTHYKDAAELLRTAYYAVQEALATITTSIDLLEMDESRLLEVDNRLDVIRQLKRKYGDSVSSVLEYFNQISAELGELPLSGSELDGMEKQLEQLHSELIELSGKLTSKRKEIARDLEKAVMEHLAELYMENTIFSVQIESSEELLETGVDKVEFYISTNIGESIKPLARVASGGELSRIMLALKTIFSKTKSITSVVFDEVDTGVSGRVAQAIAEKIHQIGINSQVLCITHLPQVAAVADMQYFIKKKVQGDRTETSIDELTQRQRVDEIARMLAGSEVTDLTKEHAKELLLLAKK